MFVKLHVCTYWDIVYAGKLQHPKGWPQFAVSHTIIMLKHRVLSCHVFCIHWGVSTSCLGCVSPARARLGQLWHNCDLIPANDTRPKAVSGDSCLPSSCTILCACSCARTRSSGLDCVTNVWLVSVHSMHSTVMVGVCVSGTNVRGQCPLRSKNVHIRSETV